DDATILLHTGGGWPLQGGGAGNTLNAAFGLAVDQFLAVGTSPGYCTNTSCEDPVATALFGVWGRSTSDAFAVGEAGVILHHDTGFTQLASDTSVDLHAIFGIGARILVVGNGGTILRSDNDSDWSAESSGTMNDLFAVWMTGAEAFAVGAG